MKSLQLGIRFVLWGLIAIVAVYVGAYVLMQYGGQLGFGIPTVRTLLRILNVVYLGGAVLAVAGKLMCLRAPAEMGGVGVLYAAIAIDFGGLAVAVTNYFTPIPFGIMLAALISGLVVFVLFVLFLMRVAKFRDRLDMVTLGESALVGTGGCIALIAGMAALREVAGGLFSCFNLVLLIALVVAAVVTFFRYVTLMLELSQKA